eukprot:TRINITY_DN55634_c0_g1_i1.p1 TRINITY_DN55634_c0_g1~~TRINITY_DN55634_c0_g1_i1.p1  ORF type:complete len:207 (-),score=57.32 TRINITY_DN55634_c0_g1_i1:15-635(-)
MATGAADPGLSAEELAKVYEMELLYGVSGQGANQEDRCGVIAIMITGLNQQQLRAGCMAQGSTGAPLLLIPPPIVGWNSELATNTIAVLDQEATDKKKTVFCGLGMCATDTRLVNDLALRGFRLCFDPLEPLTTDPSHALPSSEQIAQAVIGLHRQGHGSQLLLSQGTTLKSSLRSFCLLYTSDAADEEDSVDLCGRRIIKKKKKA